MPPKEIMKYLGAEWRKLSPQQQEAYKSKVPNTPANKSESMSVKSQSNKQQTSGQLQSEVKSASKTETSGKHQSMTKKKGEQSASRKAPQHQDEEQSDTASVE